MKKETNQTIEQLLVSLGVKPKNIKHYEEAFTHRSFLNENRSDKTLSHNERLEFLGDAVLELIISEYLFHTFPDRPEGELTSFRAATVKTDTLADVAKNLGYGNYLRMSHGEEATGGRSKDYLLANTFEAVLGAIYLDQGYEACKKCIEKVLIPRIESIVSHRLDIDAKTKFQEEAQARFKMTPIYQVIEEIGPDHEKRFVMGVFLGDKEYGRGEGASKQRAEEAAAKEALNQLEKPTL
jgi:ribonuclease-3